MPPVQFMYDLAALTTMKSVGTELHISPAF